MDKAKKRRKKMSREIRVEEGSASRIFVIVEGKEIEFKLTLVKVPRYWGDEPDKLLVYMAEDGTKARSIYSGGATGCGIKIYDMISEEKISKEQVVTQDIAEIIEFARNQKEEVEKERVAADNKKMELVEKLNNLPEETRLWESICEEGIKFYVRPGKASYNPKYSGKVNWNVSLVAVDNSGKELTIFDFSGYFKNGKRYAEAFRQYINNSFNTDWNWYVASDAMDAVKKAYDAYLVEAKKL